MQPRQLQPLGIARALLVLPALQQLVHGIQQLIERQPILVVRQGGQGESSIWAGIL